MTDRVTPNVRPRTDASEDVAAQIREYIQREGLRPGDRIGREVDLMARFQVSRPTLREACACSRART